MLAIYKRELKSYFNSMIGCVIVAFLIAFAGIYFLAYNLNYGYPYFNYVLSGILYILLIVVPVITMRSFAEEQKTKTDQMLLTYPVSLTKVVAGKFLAMASVLAIPCVVYLIYPLIIASQGTAYIKVDYLSIIIFFLLGCVYISIGMFVSSITSSQIIAAIGGFALLMITYLWSGILQFIPDSAAANMAALIAILTVVVFLIYQMTKNSMLSLILEVLVIAANVIVYFVKSSLFEGLLNTLLSSLELTEPFENIVSNQLFDLSGVILYLTLIVLFNFLTIQMIQKRRWS